MGINSGRANRLSDEAEIRKTHNVEKSARQVTWVFQKIRYKRKNKREGSLRNKRDRRPINQVPLVDFVWILTSVMLKESLEAIGDIQPLDISRNEASFFRDTY